MTSEGNWRTYLDDLVRHKAAGEKRELYEAVGVSRTAFQRWRNGDNIPDAAHLHRLLAALPEEEREYLRALILQDPKVRGLLPSEVSLQAGQATDHIPHEVYEQVLRLARDTPDRFWSLCSLILLRALSQLETHPKHTGIQISVARCMPPRTDGKVHSLRLHVGRGTAPWRGDLHTQDGFLGAESLAGYAVMQQHGFMVPDVEAPDLLLPVQQGVHERSSAAFPLRREGAIAGAIIVSCTMVDFFTQEKLTLIEAYTDLLRLAFYDDEFFPVASIDLGLMPFLHEQQMVLHTFRQRVQEQYRTLQAEPSGKALAQVEARVRSELEDELLQRVLTADTQRGR